MTRRRSQPRPRLYIMLSLFTLFGLPTLILVVQESTQDHVLSKIPFWSLTYLMVAIPVILSIFVWLALGLSRALASRALELPKRRLGPLTLLDLSGGFILAMCAATAFFSYLHLLNKLALTGVGTLQLNLTYLLNYISDGPLQFGSFFGYGLLVFILGPALVHIGCYIFAIAKANPLQNFFQMRFMTLPEDATSLGLGARMRIYSKITLVSLPSYITFFVLFGVLIIGIASIAVMLFPHIYTLLEWAKSY